MKATSCTGQAEVQVTKVFINFPDLLFTENLRGPGSNVTVYKTNVLANILYSRRLTSKSLSGLFSRPGTISTTPNLRPRVTFILAWTTYRNGDNNGSHVDCLQTAGRWLQLSMFRPLYVVFVQSVGADPLLTGLEATSYTDTCRLTTAIRSEKCVVRQFRRRANVIKRNYINLDSTAYCS